ncbi:hypothetical protein B0H19DRAFT_397658 [Mycena capillaripes]|nr:hypothetical protein B0H19DRAFT_397658 [Mycena capillaripes]
MSFRSRAPRPSPISRCTLSYIIYILPHARGRSCPHVITPPFSQAGHAIHPSRIRPEHLWYLNTATAMILWSSLYV